MSRNTHSKNKHQLDMTAVADRQLNISAPGFCVKILAAQKHRSFMPGGDYNIMGKPAPVSLTEVDAFEEYTIAQDLSQDEAEALILYSQSASFSIRGLISRIPEGKSKVEGVEALNTGIINYRAMQKEAMGLNPDVLGASTNHSAVDAMLGSLRDDLTAELPVPRVPDRH